MRVIILDAPPRLLIIFFASGKASPSIA